MAYMSGYPAAPFTADQLTAAQSSAPSCTSRVQLTDGTVLPAWNITYDLDDNRQPFGVARFTTTAPCPLDPINPVPVWINAGYDINGVASRQTVFVGWPIRTTSDGVTVTVDLTTGEDLYDTPLFGVPDTEIGLTMWSVEVLAKNANTSWASVPLPRWPLHIFPWNLDAAPTPGFSSLPVSSSSNTLEILTNLAASMGQRVRGDRLGRALNALPNADGTLSATATPGPTLLHHTELTYNAAAAPTLGRDQWFNFSATTDAADYANVIELTANWSEPGVAKTSKWWYSAGGTPPNRRSFRDVSVRVVPELSGGVRNLGSSSL